MNNVSGPALTPLLDFVDCSQEQDLSDRGVENAVNMVNVVNVVNVVSAVQIDFTEHAVPLAYRIWCRGIDIVFSLIGIVILFILLVIFVPLMMLDSPGPVFYYQERMGYRGKSFRIIKLRSMHVDAERGGRAIWAKKHDSRVTRIGRFLRATHLDELPQVINILRSEMSLIGPRPEREEYARELEWTHSAYRMRSLVKPGLTGLAQVNYGYGDSSKSELEKLQYDLFYIQRRSIQLDILILWKTIGEVVGGHGI